MPQPYLGDYFAAAPSGAAAIELAIRSDSSFTLKMPDGATGAPTTVQGTYIVEGQKLTLATTQIGGKPASDQDAKPVSAIFDPKERTLTVDTGGGPRLLLHRR